MSIIGKNIKRLRQEQNETQKQLADDLCISIQAISKWENEDVSPDIMLLPKIAEHYNVTIDELFREQMTAYKHKAQRLLSVYEDNIENKYAFEKADREYQRLFDKEKFDAEDLGDYAYLYDCHMRFCMKKAEEYYKKSLEADCLCKGGSYYSTQRQYIIFLNRVGKIQKAIGFCWKYVELEPDNAMNYASLLCAYKSLGIQEDTKDIVEKGLEKFPDNEFVVAYAGDIYYLLKEYDKAKICWEKVLSLNGERIDTRYALAEYYEKIHQWDEALDIYNDILKLNEDRGYIIEYHEVSKRIDKLLINKN